MNFVVKLAQHMDQNAKHAVKITTGQQFVYQAKQNHGKDRSHEAETTKNQSRSINHNIRETSPRKDGPSKLMQYAILKE